MTKKTLFSLLLFSLMMTACGGNPIGQKTVPSEATTEGVSHHWPPPAGFTGSSAYRSR